MKILICITELNYRLFQSILYTSPDTEKSENSSHDPLTLRYRTSEHNETNAHWGIFFRLFCKMQRNVAYISASVNIARHIPPGTGRAPLRSTLFMLYKSEWEPLQTIQRVRQRTERIIQTDFTNRIANRFTSWFDQAFEQNWLKRMNHSRMGIAHCPEKSRQRVWNKFKHF